MVTMKDVAAAAGVSQASVSYAYNHPARLSEALVEHIFRTAGDLRYAGPNIVGSSLRSGKIGAIGVMVMDSLEYAFSDPSTKALLEGVVQGGQLKNLALTLLPLPHRDYGSLQDMHKSRDGVQTALRGLVDGVLLHSLPDDHPAIHILLRRAIPMVIVDAPRLEGLPMVGIEDRRAAFNQIVHLIEAGHRRIGIIAERLRPDGYSGPVSRERRAEAVEHVVRERLEGYEAGCLLHGIDFDSLPVIEAGGFNHERGLTAANDLLDEHNVTAIAATSDTMALAAMEAAAAHGLDVPSRLSIIGFDDVPGAHAAGLTTIRQPMVEKGRLATKMLFELLAGENDVKSVVLPTELVVRQTTAPWRE
jgi:DNA-binding LacI/PurR family transcriptional regulator